MPGSNILPEPAGWHLSERNAVGWHDPDGFAEGRGLPALATPFEAQGVPPVPQGTVISSDVQRLLQQYPQVTIEFFQQL